MGSECVVLFPPVAVETPVLMSKTVWLDVIVEGSPVLTAALLVALLSSDRVAYGIGEATSVEPLSEVALRALVVALLPSKVVVPVVAGVTPVEMLSDVAPGASVVALLSSDEVP